MTPEQRTAEYARLAALPNSTVQERSQRLRLKQLRAKEKAAGRPKPKTCEICGDEHQKIVWDHCHTTDKFRGWICNPCNLILGGVKDDIELLLKMALYLEHSKNA